MFQKILRRWGDQRKMKLNVGCYNKPLEGYLNLDIHPYNNNVNIIHDLEKFPYPFKNSTFKEINCSFVLEHIDPNKTMKVINEFHRISQDKGIIKIAVPYEENWWRDLDHKRGFNYFSFLRLSKNNKSWRTDKSFIIKKIKGIPTPIGKLIPKIPLPFKISKGEGTINGKQLRLNLRDFLSMTFKFIIMDVYVELIVKK